MGLVNFCLSRGDPGQTKIIYSSPWCLLGKYKKYYTLLNNVFHLNNITWVNYFDNTYQHERSSGSKVGPAKSRMTAPETMHGVPEHTF